MKKYLIILFSLFTFNAIAQDNTDPIKPKNKSYVYYSYGIGDNAPYEGYKNYNLSINRPTNHYFFNTSHSLGINNVYTIVNNKGWLAYIPIEMSYNKFSYKLVYLKQERRFIGHYKLRSFTINPSINLEKQIYKPLYLNIRPSLLVGYAWDATYITKEMTFTGYTPYSKINIMPDISMGLNVKTKYVYGFASFGVNYMTATQKYDYPNPFNSYIKLGVGIAIN